MRTLNAQPRPERPSMPSPEEIAQRKTEKMDQEIGLNEKQFKKIYKIYLKEENAKKEAREGGFPPMRGFPDGMPGGPRPATVNGKDIESDEYIDLRVQIVAQNSPRKEQR